MIITQKIEQALYIKDLKHEIKHIKQAMTDEASLWVESAHGLPDHFHSEMEPNYMGILMGLNGFNCQDDAPMEEIDILKNYINKKIDDKVKENVEFLRLRTTSLKENIKYLKEKFEKDWKQSYKIVLKEIGKQEDTTMIKNLDIDDILDKISRDGINSLSEEEKKILKIKGGEDEDEN